MPASEGKLKDKLTIFQLVTQLERAGAQSLSRWLEDALVKKGHLVETRFLYLKTHADDLFPPHACLSQSRSKLVRDAPQVLLGLARAIRSADVIVAHTHFCILLLGLIAPLGARLVMVHHWPERRYPMVVRVGLFLIRLLRRNLVEVSVSPTAKSRHVAVVIPNPVPVAHSQTECSSEDASIDLLCVARHSYEKGIDVLLEAMKSLEDRHLTLVGVGKLTEELRDRARTLEVFERVSFRGSIANQQVRAAMRSCSVFVLPSRWEAMPMAILEAVAEDCDIVVSEIQAHQFVLEAGAALGAPVGSASALANAIQRVPSERVRLLKGRRLLEKMQGEDAIGDAWVRVLAGGAQPSEVD